MWTKMEVFWLDTGYNMWPWPLTSPMALTLDVSRSNFEIAQSGIVGLIDAKWKGSELIWYWADCMTLPFDHIHDLDLGVSRSESEITLSQEWSGRLTMNEKDVSHPFMTMILTCMTMVGWADVLDNDWGDFRHWRAVDISSCSCSKIFWCTCNFYIETKPQWSFSYPQVCFSQACKFILDLLNDITWASVNEK